MSKNVDLDTFFFIVLLEGKKKKCLFSDLWKSALKKNKINEILLTIQTNRLLGEIMKITFKNFECILVWFGFFV